MISFTSPWAPRGLTLPVTGPTYDLLEACIYLHLLLAPYTLSFWGFPGPMLCIAPFCADRICNVFFPKQISCFCFYYSFEKETRWGFGDCLPCFRKWEENVTLSSVIVPRSLPSGRQMKQLSTIPFPDIHKLTTHHLCKGAQAEAD